MKRKKRKSNAASSSSNPPVGEGFSKDDYNRVMTLYNPRDRSPDDAPLSHPADPIGFEQVNQYKCSVLNIHRKQVADGCNNVPWELVFDFHCANLMNMVCLIKKQKLHIHHLPRV